MTRRKLTPEQLAEMEPRGSIVPPEPGSRPGLSSLDFAGESRPPKARSKKMARTAFDRGVVDAITLLRSRRFDEWKSKHYVYVYAYMHDQVYGALPLELLADMGKASAAAALMVRHEFDGNIEAALAYMRWTWQREKATFPTRTSDFRVGWRYQFASKKLLTDYRIALTKKRTTKA